MYYDKLVESIETYIGNEINDSLFYCELSHKAPDTAAKSILIELSNDEKLHAQSFTQAYYYLTGRMYVPQTPSQIDVPDYEEGLRSRILAETGDYKEYGKCYLEAHNEYLRNLFFVVKMAEARHAMRVPILLGTI